MHKVFVSYHHEQPDQVYRDQFEQIFAKRSKVFITKSVQIGDINPQLNTETIRQKIRDEYLADSTVTVVLVGRYTWQRKHVDWEIASSIRDTKNNSRSGLLGILLPSYQQTTQNVLCYNRHTVPPRLYFNVVCGYANIYPWSTNPTDLTNWIALAFERRNRITPDNSYPSYINNRPGDQWY